MIAKRTRTTRVMTLEEPGVPANKPFMHYRPMSRIIALLPYSMYCARAETILCQLTLTISQLTIGSRSKLGRATVSEGRVV
jgi:hypothetical protein